MTDAPAWLRVAVPLTLGVLLLAAWEAAVSWYRLPRFVLPPPSLIARALVSDFPALMASLWVTLRITLMAFGAALLAGIALAVLSAQSRLLRISLFPYAVALQVTPVVAIAPLVLIWVGVDHLDRALLILASLVAFFPIFSNTALGLASVDHTLDDLFRLHGATRWQRLTRLQLPSALPYLLGGARISGGLALIGAVVAEFVAGSGNGSGLAWRITESANRLNIPRMFAALALLSGLGVAIFLAVAAAERRLLRNWHDSAVPRDR